MQPLTDPYVYGVNRRSENFLLLSDLLFAWGRCTRSRYKCVEICFVLGCVFNFMMCSKVIYTGLIKTEIGNWNSDGYFIELVQYAENLGGKSRKNLVEHPIIKMIRKVISIIHRFFAPHSQDNAFSLLQGPKPTFYSQTWRYKFLNSWKNAE